jgi:hypothetical protein
MLSSPSQNSPWELFVCVPSMASPELRGKGLMISILETKMWLLTRRLVFIKPHMR